MKLGPDGTLCRITSSIKDSNNIMIITLPNSDLQKPPSCKLVVIGAEKNASESLSEKSEDESDKMVKEENRKNYTDSNRNTNLNNDIKNKSSPVTNINHRRPQFNHTNYHRSQNRHRSHSHNFNATRRNYNSGGNMSKSFQNSSNDGPIWMHPPLYNHQLLVHPIFSGPTQIEQLPIAPTPNLDTNVAVTGGLLGASPYSPLPQLPPPFFPRNWTNETIVKQNEHPDQGCWVDKSVPIPNGIPINKYWDDEPSCQKQKYWNEGRTNSYARSAPLDRNQENPSLKYNDKPVPPNHSSTNYDEPEGSDGYWNNPRPNNYRPGRKNPINTHNKDCDKQEKQNTAAINEQDRYEPPVGYRNDDTYRAPIRSDRNIPRKATDRTNYQRRFKRYNQDYRNQRGSSSRRWNQPNDQDERMDSSIDYGFDY